MYTDKDIGMIVSGNEIVAEISMGDIVASLELSPSRQQFMLYIVDLSTWKRYLWRPLPYTIVDRFIALVKSQSNNS